MHDQSIKKFDWIKSYPKSFSALMELYEENYISMRLLCPYLKKMDPEIISSIDGDGHDLHLHILERVPQTTTIRLTYRMQDGSYRPDLKVRVYHDARQAEVLSRQCRVGGTQKTRRSADESALLCRWRLNRFLFKWLNYSLRQGHIFLPEVPSAKKSQTKVTPELLD